MSENRLEKPSGADSEPPAKPTSIIQPIIDELKKGAQPQLPVDNATPPPRGPIHPPQPVEP